MIDFAILPPEINSARMYSGPGAGSLLTAAGSWDSLAAELGTSAETYDSVLSNLTSLSWNGPAAAAMTASAMPFVSWLATAAQQTRQTAMQARAAAAAYEQAFAMTVPPPLITANRSRLTSLIATNFFGQNTAAIAATELQYAEMWAQDASAMYSYSTSSATATVLTAFSSPQQTTTSDAASAQSSAVSQALSTPAANTASALSDLVSNLQSILPSDFTILDATAVFYSAVTATSDIDSVATGVIGAENNLGILPDLGVAAAAAPAALAPALSAQLSGAGSGLGGLSGAVTATLTGANRIGPMSVPASWSAPSSGPISVLSGSGLTTLPGTDVPEPNAGEPGVPGMPFGAMQRASGVIPRYGARLTVMSRPLAGG